MDNVNVMKETEKDGSGRKWYEKYLPFVAQSSEVQIKWLANNLTKLREAGGLEKTGTLSGDEITPYIRLFLEANCSEEGHNYSGPDQEYLMHLLDSIGVENLHSMIECTEIYDVPVLFSLVRNLTTEQAVLALKKVPPSYEKNPLLVMDRVFHAVKENSTELLDNAAKVVLESNDAPENFSANYERFREIMMDEHILSLLYPKAK